MVFVPESATSLWTIVSPLTSAPISLKYAKFVNGVLNTSRHCPQWHVNWRIGSLADFELEASALARGDDCRVHGRVPVTPNDQHERRRKGREAALGPSALWKGLDLIAPLRDEALLQRPAVARWVAGVRLR